MQKFKLAPLFLILNIFLISCTGESKIIPNKISETDIDLYNHGKEEMFKNHKKSIKFFDKIAMYYPQSSILPNADLMKAYLYYINYSFDEAELAAEKFIHDYPTHHDVSYAYYIKAMSLYMQLSDVTRDHRNTLDAINAMQDVLMLYPESEYALDMKQRIIYATNLLAGKEMEIARFYEKNSNFISAINRYKYVIEKYDGTAVIPEALYRISFIYHILGIYDGAQKYADVYKYNYPTHHCDQRYKAKNEKNHKLLKNDVKDKDCNHIAYDFSFLNKKNIKY